MFHLPGFKKKRAVLIHSPEESRNQAPEEDLQETVLLEDFSSPPNTQAAGLSGPCGAETASDEGTTLLEDIVLSAQNGKQAASDQRALAYITDLSTGARASITKNEVVLGRRSETGKAQADVQILDRMISRRHAKIFYLRGGFWLEDMESLNGTFLEGRRLEPNAPCPLSHGVHFRLYKREFLFETGDTRRRDEFTAQKID